MASLNKIMLMGNLGGECEMRFTPNGNPVTKFRMAVNHTFTNSSGERKSDVEWFTVVCWNKLAESCNTFLKKGSRAYVEGRLRSRSWDKPDGGKGFAVEVVAEKVLFLDKMEQKSTSELEPKPDESGSPETEDLPF